MGRAPAPAVPGVVLPHVLDEVCLLQAFVSWRSGYVFGSAGEKQVTLPLLDPSWPQERGGGHRRGTQAGSLPLTRGTSHCVFQKLEGAALGRHTSSVRRTEEPQGAGPQGATPGCPGTGLCSWGGDPGHWPEAGLQADLSAGQGHPRPGEPEVGRSAERKGWACPGLPAASQSSA